MDQNNNEFFTLREMYNKQNRFFTIEQMVSLHNNPNCQTEFNDVIQKVGCYKTIQSNSNNKGFSSRKKSYEAKEMRILTSLHIEKDKDKTLIKRAVLPPPWTVGLVINLARTYDRKGNKLKKERQVKCLTILYLSGNMSLDETEKYFNDPNKVSLSTLKQYCGFLSISYAIEGWDTLEMAKEGLMCWKTKTRGKFSRQKCGGCVYEIFKEKCKNLQYFTPKFPPSDIIKRYNTFL